MWHVDYILKDDVIHDNTKYKTKKEAMEMVKKQRPIVTEKWGKNKLSVRFLKNWK